MNEEDRKQYVLQRIETAYEALNSATHSTDGGFLSAATSRLYYAAFYTVKALLVFNGIQTKTHAATLGQFSQHFLKTGIIDKKYVKLLSELFDNRQEGDYEERVVFEEESVRSCFEQVREMIEKIESEIGLA
jgi:uncharacterized protein (UPF0332 family)